MRPQLPPRKVRLNPDEKPRRAEILTVPDDSGRPSLAWIALSGALLLTACAGRPLGAADGGVIPTSDGLAAVDAGRIPPPTPVPAGSCTVAIRVDNCCTAPLPVPSSALVGDPCLLPYPVKVLPKACVEKWPKTCDLIDCAAMEPPTRTVGLDPTGKCVWKSECEISADCIMGIDARDCCPCQAGYPRSLLQTDACLVQQPTTDDKPYPPPGCKDACGDLGMMCDGCPGLPPIYPPARCENSAGDPTLKVCAPWPGF